MGNHLWRHYFVPTSQARETSIKKGYRPGHIGKESLLKADPNVVRRVIPEILAATQQIAKWPEVVDFSVQLGVRADNLIAIEVLTLSDWVMIDKLLQELLEGVPVLDGG